MFETQKPISTGKYNSETNKYEYDFESYFDGDFVIIDKTRYTGTLQIDIILSTNFTVAFQADPLIHMKGFVLNWSCTQWGEWARSKDGNCGYEMRPLHNGTMTRGLLKYKSNETCGK